MTVSFEVRFGFMGIFLLGALGRSIQQEANGSVGRQKMAGPGRTGGGEASCQENGELPGHRGQFRPGGRRQPIIAEPTRMASVAGLSRSGILSFWHEFFRQIKASWNRFHHSVSQPRTDES